MTQDAIKEALAKAVQEVKQEEVKKPSLEKAPGEAARKAAEFSWTPGQRDMALKMHLDGKSLAEIRQEIDRPAEEIVLVLGLDKARPKRQFSEWAPMIKAYTEKGYSDSLIAEILNADGNRTSRGNLWTRQRIYCARHRMKKISQ
ncbi:MAG: hypothetical protein QM449_04755 [Synergistota bacterium]|nr:hypothetical protein [Synergistota bacterium]